MASSRKPALPEVLFRLIEAVAADLAQRLLSLERPRVAVAFSGGRDSTVLLDVLMRLRTRLGFELAAFHIHHGLSSNADAWAGHAIEAARRLGADCFVRKVEVERRARASVEAQARDARYHALDELCAEHEIDLLALAHHADDQAETVLLQLSRGAGLAGLAAMPHWTRHGRCARWRPLLEFPGSDLLAYAQAAELAFVDDESNRDLRYRRNALRHDVLPALVRHAPGAIVAIGRSARHVQEALALAREIGSEDVARLRARDGLSIEALTAMRPERRKNALRTWIEMLGVPAPSDARLDEIWRQAGSARDNAQPSIEHAGGRFVRHRGVLQFAPGRRPERPAVRLDHWDGMPVWRLDGWSGQFRFMPTVRGIAEAVLRSLPLSARARSGGERLRLAGNRPARDLKHWYQSFGVPVWQREAAPLLWLGDRLAYVPHVGIAQEFISEDMRCLALEWEADAGRQAGLAELQHV